MCARETRTAFSNFLQKANAINELSKYTAPPPTPRTPVALAAVTVVDSATSYTLMGNSDTLTSVMPAANAPVISQADGTPLQIVATGIHPTIPGSAGDVVVVKDLPIDLISWGALENDGYIYSIDPDRPDHRHWSNTESHGRLCSLICQMMVSCLEIV